MSKYFKMKKSKKGLTLVEILCAVFVLAIVFVGVLNAVAFSRQMVFTNNSKEKASFKGQLVADEIFSIVSGSDPDTVSVEDISTKIADVVNNEEDPQNNAEDSRAAVGKATYVGRYDDLSDPASFTPVEDSYIEYAIEPIDASMVVDNAVNDGTGQYTEAREKGWNITVRVFYHEISADSEYRFVDISVFAPFNYISD